MSVTQKELLSRDYDFRCKGMFDGILYPGLYILAGTSKSGKTMLCTSMSNCIAKGESFLGKSMLKGKVIYFDNDNYEFEAAARLKALDIQATDDILYEFDKSKSIWDIKSYLNSLDNIDDFLVVVIDCFVGLDEIASSDDSYNEIYTLIKELRDLLVKHGLIGIIIHHTKKAKDKKTQDNLLGSRAYAGAVTGTILLDIANEFDDIAKLSLVLRNHREIIPLRRHETLPTWILDSDETDESCEIEPNILKIIKTVVGSKHHYLSGSCQEIANICNLDINPYCLTKFLKLHSKTLKENGITFENKKSNNKRKIMIEYTDNEE